MASPALLFISFALGIGFLAYFDLPKEFRLPDILFYTLWGYPTFIAYEYDPIDVEPARRFDQISELVPKSEPVKWLHLDGNVTQRCDFALSSSDSCVYNLTTEKCSSDNRLPLLWENANVECYDAKESEIDCLLSEMKVENGSCHNVPDKIIYQDQKAKIYFTDVKLNTWHSESTVILEDEFNCSFVKNEKLVADSFFGLWKPDDGQKCSGDTFSSISYGIKIYSSCQNLTEVPRNNETCDDLSQRSMDFLLSQVNATSLCKCDICNIPIVFERPHNTTFWIAENETEICSVPSKIEVIVYTNETSVTYIHLRMVKRNFTCHWNNDSCLISLDSEVRFEPTPEESKVARFWLTRGRFHCPSEVTCWKEIFYFVKLIDFYAPYAEYLSLILIFVVSVMYLFMRHYTKSFSVLLGIK
ncbi:hypothetical protein L596_017174 [Steinernema carpocapsae]|uniref:Uncharacterized protein n=1 Tax=Steinernema carpocapsae TaxID=34508 RepID=A0A4U5N0U1_STECR|nr:hypothetical protein L596_017174 [Steinernema carpocapsae]